MRIFFRTIRKVLGLCNRLLSPLRKGYIRSKISPSCWIDVSVQIFPTARLINAHGQNGAIQVGAYSVLLGELLTFANGGNIEIGEYCYLGDHSRIWSSVRIKIGNRVLIAHDVNIFDNTTHPVDDARARHEQFKAILTSGHPKIIELKPEEIIIDDDAWIAAKSIILPGVTIGEGAVVGAGSVVTKDVPPYTLAAGNPARPIRPLKRPER